MAVEEEEDKSGVFKLVKGEKGGRMAVDCWPSMRSPWEMGGRTRESDGKPETAQAKVAKGGSGGMGTDEAEDDKGIPRPLQERQQKLSTDPSEEPHLPPGGGPEGICGRTAANGRLGLS